jgi:predicted component of type VI protein secretion system
LATNPTQVWFISKSPFTIGSAPGNDLYAGQLAPQHARVEYEPSANGYVLTDLSNGQTWVNDRPVQGRHKINNNFRVRLGTVDLIFSL